MTARAHLTARDLVTHVAPGALAVNGLKRRFGGVVAADDVTFSVPTGQFLAVVGPNGAGKSTLIQIITGFVRPQSGSVRLGDRDLTALAPERIAALGISRTFQTSRVFPSLSVRESVMVGAQADLVGGGRLPRFAGPMRELSAVLLGGRAYRERLAALEAEAESVLKLFGERLWPRRDEPAYSLSYANRRRLEIARALVSRPDVLLLDEPAAGMNPTETDELTEVIAELHRQRPELIILMVEHKLQVVRRLASRCIVMNMGAVLVDATPDEALENPSVVEAYLGRRRSAAAFGRAEPER